MSSVSDTALIASEDKVEAARQEQPTELKAELVEMGKVSDTSGGWFGAKVDAGVGFVTY